MAKRPPAVITTKDFDQCRRHRHHLDNGINAQSTNNNCINDDDEDYDESHHETKLGLPLMVNGENNNHNNSNNNNNACENEENYQKTMRDSCGGGAQQFKSLEDDHIEQMIQELLDYGSVELCSVMQN